MLLFIKGIGFMICVVHWVSVMASDYKGYNNNHSSTLVILGMIIFGAMLMFPVLIFVYLGVLFMFSFVLKS